MYNEHFINDQYISYGVPFTAISTDPTQYLKYSVFKNKLNIYINVYML